MLEHLTAHELTLTIKPSLASLTAPQSLPETASLSTREAGQAQGEPWLGQPVAQQAASMGLRLRHAGYAVAVVADHDTGIADILRQEMSSVAQTLPPPHDLVYVNHFARSEQPSLFRLRAGAASTLRNTLNQFTRALCKAIANYSQEQAAREDEPPGPSAASSAVSETKCHESPHAERLTPIIQQVIETFWPRLQETECHHAVERARFDDYLTAMQADVLANAPLIHAHMVGDNEGAIETLVSRYQVNLLVDYPTQASAPVLVDEDPSLQSLFGGIEASSDHGADLPDFMRIRAGHLIKANGGFLMLHLRDLLADQQHGPTLIEKLYRFLRNGNVHIEDASSQANQTVAVHTMVEAIPVDVKLVLLATPQEFYTLQEDMPDFANALRHKVELEEPVLATEDLYHALAKRWHRFVTDQGLPPLDASANIALLTYLHRVAESQQRISSRWALAEQLIIEAAYVCEHQEAQTSESKTHAAGLGITASHIEHALLMRQQRNCLTEQQWRNAIIDGEIVVNVHGRAVGQINGLTHVDMGDHSFGSPVRISARCYAGESGVVNIDREIQMTGASHDKGLLILKHWLSASFAHLTPLSLNASLVFEQEYQGVDGDSATCAELYALLSAIAGLSLPQGIAVTGAMNQHGEVMAVGGLNEKIEGYFSLCQTLGLNGSQGVLIPSRNLNHLMLNPHVVNAVEAGQFQIIAIDHVLDGMEFLTGLNMGHADATGHYSSETLMGRVERALEEMRKTMAENKPTKSH